MCKRAKTGDIRLARFSVLNQHVFFLCVLPAIYMQRFKGVASGKQSFREHCATKMLLEANPRNISASKISRYIRYI